jgi:hypothetical protein
MPVYVNEYADELKKVGRESFVRTYPNPVLIVASLAGTLDDGAQQGASTAVVSGATDLLHVTRLVGRVFVIVKGRYSPPGPVTIGRTNDNDVAFPDYSVSKRHCQLAVVGRELRLIDNGSTNGTFLNGLRLAQRKPVVLNTGDTVTLGRFNCIFHLPAGFVGHLAAQAA